MRPNKSIWLHSITIIIVVMTIVGLERLPFNKGITYGYPGPGSTPATTPGFPQGGSKLSLPLVMRPPVQLPLKKIHTGIFLGNRSIDWNTTNAAGAYDFLFRLRGGTTNGIYPAVVVVLTAQVFTTHRGTSSVGCAIDAQPSIRSPFVYQYLKDAALHGTKVIFRVWPSPGNFRDVFEPGIPHRLLVKSGETPPYPTGGNADYCNGRDQYFRAIDDISKDMSMIHGYIAGDGWTEYGYIPANEPNIEWYSGTTNPPIYVSTAWDDMNQYFSNLYALHGVTTPQHILTPPMAQNAYAENLRLGDCTVSNLADVSQSGYEVMSGVYTNMNDGYTWNNYCAQTKEFWQAGLACPVQGQPPTNQHLFQFFPQFLKNNVLFQGKDAFTIESDLYSPCPG